MDWRLELKPDCRPKQIDKILLSLIFFFPNCVSMDLDELKKMAEWLEEDHFIDAKSYIDYLDRISARLQKMEMRFPTFESHWMNNQGQQLLSQNTIVSDGAKKSASLSPALPSMTSTLTQTSVPKNVVAGLKMQSGIAKKQVSSQELHHHQLMKQNPPTQMSNVVGRSTNTQSEIAHAEDLFQNPPTQMSNDVGRRSTKRQSETAHAQDLFQQKKQQHQLMNPQLFSSSMNSSNAQTGQNADDWQEKIYQEMQAIKIRYLPYLKKIYQKNFKESEHLKRNDSVSNVPQSERQKLWDLLEGHMRILNVSKDSVVPVMKNNLSKYEKKLIYLIESNLPREPVSAPHKIQQPGGGHPLSTPPQPQPQQQQQEERLTTNQMQPKKS